MVNGDTWSTVPHLTSACSPAHARMLRPVLTIPFLVVPKIGSCEHIGNDLPTHGSIILKKRMEIGHTLFSSDTLLERQIFVCYTACDCFGAKLKILCYFWRSDRVNTLQMTFRHSHHKSGTLKSDCFQLSEPRIGSLKLDRVKPWKKLWVLSCMPFL